MIFIVERINYKASFFFLFFQFVLAGGNFSNLMHAFKNKLEMFIRSRYGIKL